MSNYPSEWRFETIGDICEIHDSKRIPLSSEQRRDRKGPYPYYGANNIQDSIDDFIFDFDAVLLAEDGGYYDEYETRDIAQYATGRYWVNNHAHILTGSESLDTRFLYFSLVRKNICPWINTGTRAKLNQADLRQIEIAVPPLPEQKKIAEILSGIDKTISIKRQAINDLEATREALCSELIQNGAWSQEEIGDLTSHMTNGFVGTATPHYRERGVRYLTSKNIRRDRIDPRRMIYISEEFHMANQKSSLRVGDVLMVQSGHIGTTAVVTNDYKDCNCHALILMRFNQERLDPEYASLYFNSATGKTRLSDIFVGSTVKHVNTGDLRKFKIPVPPLGVQRDIAKRISAIDLLLGKRELQIEKLVIVKQAISSDLLSGRKRVSV